MRVQHGPRESPSRGVWRHLLYGILVHRISEEPVIVVCSVQYREVLLGRKGSTNEEFDALSCSKDSQLGGQSLCSAAALIHLEVDESIGLHWVVVEQGEG